MSSSGARGNTTNYVLDGGSNNDHYTNGPNPMPNPDALQEFSVQTNSFSAEYGRNVGAIVNAVTRAGTNQYHGLAFGYFRHYKFNATNFFTPGIDDGLKRSQYGGTFGGPIVQEPDVLLRLVPGDESAAQADHAFRPGSVGGHAYRRLLRRSARPLRNPFTGELFPNNQIPTSLFSPAAVKIVNEWLPLPNPAGTDNAADTAVRAAAGRRRPSVARPRGSQLQRQAPHVRAVLGVARIDARRCSSTATSSAAPSAGPGRTRSGRSTTRYHPDAEPAEQPGGDVQPHEQLQLPDLSARLLDARHQRLQRQDAAVVLQRLAATSASTAATRIRSCATKFSSSTPCAGRRAGTSWRPASTTATAQGDTVNNFRANGRFTFSNARRLHRRRAGGLLSSASSRTSSRAIGEYKNTRMHFLATFVQDTFRVNRQLTLNLGMRWDPFFPYTDETNRLACYRPGEKSQVY